MDDVERADRDNARVIEVVTLTMAHIRGSMGDDEYEDAIRVISAEVRGAPGNLIAYLGRFAATMVQHSAELQGLDPEEYLQTIVPFLRSAE